MFQAQRIFILAPHTDDGELGCGGTIYKHLQNGDQVIYIAFSTCSDSLPQHFSPDTLKIECTRATNHLGITNTIFFDFKVRHLTENRQAILDELISLRNTYHPSIVYLPAKDDIHQDHQVIYNEGLRAFKFSTVLGYELPWNNVHFSPALFEKLEEDAIHRKIAALKEYKSQMHRTYMQEDFIQALARVRGVQANTTYAEAFEIYRFIK